MANYNLKDWQGLNEGIAGLMQGVVGRRQQEQEFQKALQMLIMQAQIKQQYDPEAQFRQQILSLITGGGGGLPQGQQPSGMGMGGQGIAPQGIGGMRPRLKGMNIGGMNLEFPQTQEEWQQETSRKVQEQKQTELAKGIPTSETGKAALARESLQNIEDVKNMLFPKGTAKSYQRWTATGSNLPLSQLPLIPSNIGAYNPQTIFRKVGAAISGRQLIQTGVAARPEETLKLIRQFAPSGLMSSKAALEGLNELQKFYQDYLNLLQTKGLQEADKWANQNNKFNNLNSLKSKYGLD